MGHDRVTCTYEIPQWAFDYLEEHEAVLFHGCEPDELFVDGSGRYVIIVSDVKGANWVGEDTFKDYGIPYDKWYEAGSEFPAGREWMRFTEPGDGDEEPMHREVPDEAKPDFAEIFREYDEGMKATAETYDLLVLKKTVSRFRLWWEDHKPLEPLIADCVESHRFLLKTNRED